MQQDLWNERTQAANWLTSDLSREADALGEGLQLLEDITTKLEQRGNASGPGLPGQYGRVTALTAAKASHLLRGIYSLCLDGLAQEAGALFRPLIEVYELLVYFRIEPERVQQVADSKLPRAGDIAKKIEGQFKDLREHFNKHASHFKFTFDSMRHLLPLPTLEIQARPSQGLETLRKNLTTLLWMEVRVTVEAANCLVRVLADAENDQLLDRVDEWQESTSKFLAASVDST